MMREWTSYSNISSMDSDESKQNISIYFSYLFISLTGVTEFFSTTLALNEFTDKVRSLLDDGNYVISIFVALTKAFDTVDHEI